ncbi:MAG: alpha-E domain-containing protein, partial [Isosphaeraceae bacterium]
MLSRVAENLYWIARYVERAENVARLLDVGFHLELDASGFARPDGYLGPTESVVMILACRDAFDRSRGSETRGGSIEAYRDGVLRFLTFDGQNPHSILSMLGKARENARACQERS